MSQRYRRIFFMELSFSLGTDRVVMLDSFQMKGIALPSLCICTLLPARDSELT